MNVFFQNWIGSEAVKRKKRAGVLPRPKVEITGVSFMMHICNVV